MGVEENKVTVRRMFTESLERGDYTAQHERRHPEFVGIHMPGGVLVRPGSATTAGSGGRGYRGAFPDWTLTIDLLIAEGDYVVARWTSRGTHTGIFDNPLVGRFPPTGRYITWRAVNIYRFQDGKVIENWLHHDERHLIQQLSGEATAEELMGEAPSSR